MRRLVFNPQLVCLSLAGLPYTRNSHTHTGWTYAEHAHMHHHSHGLPKETLLPPITVELAPIYKNGLASIRSISVSVTKIGSDSSYI